MKITDTHTYIYLYILNVTHTHTLTHTLTHTHTHTRTRTRALHDALTCVYQLTQRKYLQTRLLFTLKRKSDI